MMMRKTLVSFSIATMVLTTSVARVAHAQAPDAAAQKEAGIHFQRAVGLYGEADYRAALVEFKRAYEIAPSTTVLYNLGQTYYQLQNYAEALSTFERYVAEGGSGHKGEVENAINVLKTRVGKVDITTTTPGWEITVDDDLVGKTPLAKPVLVAIGRRKITASKPGEAPVSRFVEVAAGDTVPLTLTGLGTTPPPGGGDNSGTPPPTDSRRSTLLTVGWIGTGVLTAGTVVTGILALSSSSKLKDDRNAFPANASNIKSDHDNSQTMAVVTDILGGAAIVLGGVSLYFTLVKPSPSAPAQVGLAAGPNKLVLQGTF
jgi:hypothetical protein